MNQSSVSVIKFINRLKFKTNFKTVGTVAIVDHTTILQ